MSESNKYIGRSISVPRSDIGTRMSDIGARMSDIGTRMSDIDIGRWIYILEVRYIMDVRYIYWTSDIDFGNIGGILS